MICINDMQFLYNEISLYRIFIDGSKDIDITGLEYNGIAFREKSLLIL